MTKVLSTGFDEKLPVDEARQDFNDALDTGRPLVVVAPTGSGKSTRLPLWLADRCGETVLVVEPRRVACRSLATYLSGLIDERVGQSIGYRVRFDDRTSKQTRVIFVTTGVALRMLAGDGPSAFSAVLIDEFHERGWEVDLIGAVMLEARKQGRFDGALIFTSATIDATEIAHQISAEVVEASGRTYPVDISYRSEVPAPTSDGLEGRVRDAVRDILSREDDDGDILVFLPGKGEISDCKSALRSIADKQGLELFGIHGRLPGRFLSRAFSEHDGRRLFLSTNVAETSLTLPGVTTVIDSGLVRMRVHRGGRSALALVPISKASMDQRAGRAGRLRPGRCLRLWSQRFRPDEQTSPEIERIELDDVILHAAICGLEGSRFDEATWLSDPPPFAVEKARQRLRRTEAIDSAGELTGKGRRMAALPVAGDEARILLDPPAALASALADLVALLQLGSDLLLPKRHLRGRSFEEVKEARTELLTGADDEVFVQLRCLRSGHPHRHGLHGSALKEARRIATSLRNRLDVQPSDPTDDRNPLPSRKALADALLQRIPESAFVVRKRALKRRRDGKARRGRSEPWGNGEIELSIWPFEPPISKRSQQNNTHPVAGLVLDHFWLGNQGIGVRGTGRMVLPCSYEQLLKAGIGEVEVDRIRAGSRGGTPYIRGVIKRTHAGVVLAEEEESLRGEALFEAAAQAILERRILRPAGEAVLDDLHVWKLMARWPRRDPDRNWDGDETPPEPTEFLQNRLAELGVARDEDLMLVEPDDLRPPVAEILGTYRFEVESVAEDFPRIWEHHGRRYHCQVNPASRKVVLEPVDKKTARADDPKPRFVPRFRGFDVMYRNASRVVPIRSR